MNKEVFKKNQPVVYRTLSNALKYNRLAHAYLFTGPKGSIKQESALLFAQSLVCDHVDEDGFACQECDACKRIENEESVDFRWVHGDRNRIKKSDIIDLQDFFSTTSQEMKSRSIYLLDAFDYATPGASNSLLKFLEEPINDLYAILTADEKSNILPTIQSRCQIISFRPSSKEELYFELKKVTEDENASMLSSSGYTYQNAMDLLECDEFDLVKEQAKAYVSNWNSFKAIYKMQSELFVPKSSQMTKEWVRLWMQWVLYLMKQMDLELSVYTKIQTILVESMDVLRSPVDLALFLDKIYNQIRKVVSE